MSIMVCKLTSKVGVASFTGGYFVILRATQGAKHKIALTVKNVRPKAGLISRDNTYVACMDICLSICNM